MASFIDIPVVDGIVKRQHIESLRDALR